MKNKKEMKKEMKKRKYGTCIRRNNNIMLLLV